MQRKGAEVRELVEAVRTTSIGREPSLQNPAAGFSARTGWRHGTHRRVPGAAGGDSC